MKPTVLIASLIASFLTTTAQAAVWTTTNQWSPSFEQRYQDWVRSSWTKDLFTQPGPLQNIKLDCADAVITMRLLFAYENQLPFAIKDSTGNRTITNEMSRFDSKGNSDQRVRAFATYLFDIIDTKALTDISYPVAANRQAIHAGVFLRTDQASHHSWTVKDLDRAGIPYLIYASRPAKTMLLDRHYYPTMGFLWGQQDAKGDQISANLQTPGDATSGVGFRMFRYPQDLMKAAWQVPGYSLDQYQMNRIAWAKTMQRSLQISQETGEETTKRLIGEACKEATDRIHAVNDAINAQSKKSSSYCFNATEYDDLSTPSRDSRAIGVFKDLVGAYNSSAGQLSSATRARAESILNNRDDGSYCSLRIASGTRLTLGEAVNAGLRGRWSSNPNESLLARWGKASATSHAASCPTY